MPFQRYDFSPSASLSFQLWEACVKNSLLRAELLSLAKPSGPICGPNHKGSAPR